MTKLFVNNRFKQAVVNSRVRQRDTASETDLSQEVEKARAYFAANRPQFAVRSARARLALPGNESTVMAGPVRRRA
jgi:hypothetical protein